MLRRRKKLIVLPFANPFMELPCPGCGFLIYGPEAYGSYGICPLCNWEDCPVQFANPLDAGGPNRESLVVYQARAMSRWPLEVRTVTEEGDIYHRDSHWRPLSSEEIAHFRSATNDGERLVFNGIFTLDDCYWMNPRHQCHRHQNPAPR
jgi:hypothetical protein